MQWARPQYFVSSDAEASAMRAMFAAFASAPVAHAAAPAVEVCAAAPVQFASAPVASAASPACVKCTQGTTIPERPTSDDLWFLDPCMASVIEDLRRLAVLKGSKATFESRRILGVFSSKRFRVAYADCPLDGIELFEDALEDAGNMFSQPQVLQITEVLRRPRMIVAAVAEAKDLEISEAVKAELQKAHQPKQW